MKKNTRKKELSTGKKIAHFLKHYFGYVLLALLCALITVLVLSIPDAEQNPEETANANINPTQQVYEAIQKQPVAQQPFDIYIAD